ncbi:hypothetical protein D3C76_1739450 [compost metagenome]
MTALDLFGSHFQELDLAFAAVASLRGGFALELQNRAVLSDQLEYWLRDVAGDGGAQVTLQQASDLGIQVHQALVTGHQG